VRLENFIHFSSTQLKLRSFGVGATNNRRQRVSGSGKRSGRSG
jgi:hypothetical protein